MRIVFLDSYLNISFFIHKNFPFTGVVTDEYEIIYTSNGLRGNPYGASYSRVNLTNYRLDGMLIDSRTLDKYEFEAKLKTLREDPRCEVIE